MAVAKIGGTEYELPNINQPVSIAQPFGDLSTELPPYELDVPSAVNLLELNGFTNANAHLARDVNIVGVERADGTTEEIFADAGLLASCRLEPPLSMQNCVVCSRRRPVSAD